MGPSLNLKIIETFRPRLGSVNTLGVRWGAVTVRKSRSRGLPSVDLCPRPTRSVNVVKRTFAQATTRPRGVRFFLLTNL